MNTLQRLNDNKKMFVESIESEMDGIRNEIFFYKHVALGFPKWRKINALRKQLRKMQQQLDCVRGRYYTICRETQMLQYHA